MKKKKRKPPIKKLQKKRSQRITSYLDEIRVTRKMTSKNNEKI